jgi:hypothetical protein
MRLRNFLSEERYAGEFNWHGEVIKVTIDAKDEAQAKTKMISVLARRLDVGKNRLRMYFDGSKDNFSIAQLLKELPESLSSMVKPKVSKNTPSLFVANFFVDGIEYTFIASDPPEWEVVFELTTGRRKDIVGGKDPFRVFSGVLACLEMFIGLYSPDVFAFSAKEPSRVKLYDRLAGTIKKRHGYGLAGSQRMSGGEVRYLFKKL